MKIPQEFIAHNPIIELGHIKQGSNTSLLKYVDSPITFDQLYHITKTIRTPDNGRDIFGRGQAYRSSCGIGCERTSLEELAGITFKKETHLIRLVQDLYIAKQFSEDKGIAYDYVRYDRSGHLITDFIAKEGGYQKTMINVARFFDLNFFSGSHGTIKNLNAITKAGIPAIVFRKLNGKDKGDGHYILVYDVDMRNEIVSLFDPKYRGERPHDNLEHKGGYLTESFERFTERWSYVMPLKPGSKKTVSFNYYMFFCFKDERPKHPGKGIYYG